MDGGFLNAIVTVQRIERLVTVHLAIPRGFFTFGQQKGFGHLIRHFDPGILGIGLRVIFPQVDGFHGHTS